MKELIVYLEDIRVAIGDLEELKKQVGSFDKFRKGSLYKRAAERHFEIIGEALNRIQKLENKIEISHANDIISLRNYIAHAYDTIDYEKLWKIIVKDVPLLKKEIIALIKKEEKKFKY